MSILTVIRSSSLICMRLLAAQLTKVTKATRANVMAV